MIALEQAVDVHADVRTKNVLLHVKELADLYALKSLYDFLAHQVLSDRLNVNLFFGGSIYSERSREVLTSSPTQEQFRSASIDAVVGCYSDLGREGDLAIDISVLKNSVVPLTDKEKMKLRAKYEIPTDRPVLVIGYADTSSDVARIAEAASKLATVYLVGYGEKDDLKLSKEAKKRVHLITKHGILKDYYALADAAVNGRNISYSAAPLHNFVEATEGGPLFMVPSSNTAQYGYRQLVDAGVIVEGKDSNDLISKLTAYLQNFDGSTSMAKARAAKARARHLKHTRETYFPAILAQLRKILGEEAEIPESDILVTDVPNGVRMMHPDSAWGYETWSSTITNKDGVEKLNEDKINKFSKVAQPPYLHEQPEKIYGLNKTHPEMPIFIGLIKKINESEGIKPKGSNEQFQGGLKSYFMRGSADWIDLERFRPKESNEQFKGDPASYFMQSPSDRIETLTDQEELRLKEAQRDIIPSSLLTIIQEHLFPNEMIKKPSQPRHSNLHYLTLAELAELDAAPPKIDKFSF